MFYLENSLDTPYIVPNNGLYYAEKLIKLANWRASLSKDKNNKKTKYSNYGADVLPGDSLVCEVHFKLNNSHFPLNNSKEYVTRNKRTARRVIKNGVITHMPLFEKYLPLGLAKVLYYMNLDELREVPKESAKLTSRRIRKAN